MERTLSPEEKIRRAEEIYYRRKNQGTQYSRTKVATVNVAEKKSLGLFKKMSLQILICLVIYFIFYLVQNGNYIFSEDVIQKTKEILSYDVNLPGLYQQATQYLNEQVKGLLPPDTKQEANQANNTISDNTVQQGNTAENSNTVNTATQEGMGGGELTPEEMETAVAGAETTEGNPVNQPQTDEEYIKSKVSLIKPVYGVVSSEFGERETTNPIVSPNHKGIDVAANTGTIVVAAMSGTVTISSTAGDYGQHIKITNGDISTLYAHCSKLYVNVGDVIEQGQAIAEVGSTGKSTGPHLHFEVMRGTTCINPRNFLDF